MFLHAQCICYIIAILVMTGMGFRSGFLLLIALAFYTLTTLINLISGLMLRGIIFAWFLFYFFNFLFYGISETFNCILI